MENNLEIVAAIDKIAEKFGIVIDWTAKNVVPQVQDILERYCSYLMAKNIVFILIALLIAVITIWFIVKYYKEGCLDTFELTLIGFGLMIYAIIVVVMLLNIVELVVCPEMYLMELLM